MQGLNFSEGKEEVGVGGSVCLKEGGTRNIRMDSNLLRFVQRACSTLGSRLEQGSRSYPQPLQTEAYRDRLRRSERPPLLGMFQLVPQE